jgi:hypothetical protein
MSDLAVLIQEKAAERLEREVEVAALDEFLDLAQLVVRQVPAAVEDQAVELSRDFHEGKKYATGTGGLG